MSPEHYPSDESWQDWHPSQPDSGAAAPVINPEAAAEASKYLSQTPKEYDLGFRDTTSEKPLRGSANQVKFIDLKDDGSAIFKPAKGEEPDLRHEVQAGTYHKRERAAYLVSKFLDLGLVPPTVIREIDGEVGSTQEFIPDANVAKYTEIDKNDQQLKESLVKLWLFDYIIWNSDRHGGNLLLKDSQAFAIDNGLSFGADHLRTFKGFYGLEIPDHIKQLFTTISHEGQLLNILQELLAELVSAPEAQACISRIQYLAVFLAAEDQIEDEYDLPYDPENALNTNVADYHPTHDSQWHKRTFERDEPTSPDMADLEAMMAEIRQNLMAQKAPGPGAGIGDELLELIQMME